MAFANEKAMRARPVTGVSSGTRGLSGCGGAGSGDLTGIPSGVTDGSPGAEAVTGVAWRVATWVCGALNELAKR